MIRLVLAAALAATGIAGGASATTVNRDLTARWDEARQQYCVKASSRDAGPVTGTRIRERECRSEAEWRDMGLTFSQRGRTAVASR